MLKKLLKALVSFWERFFPKGKIDEMEYIPLPEPEPIKPMETNQEKLIKVAKDALDTDVSPQNFAPQEYSCAEGVSNIIKNVFPDFPVILSTADLFQKLKADKRFKMTLTPIMGCIVVSPRTATINGHTGIFITNERIASNDSRTGLWKGNYDFDSWAKTFGIRGRGLHTYLFQIIS